MAQLNILESGINLNAGLIKSPSDVEVRPEATDTTRVGITADYRDKFTIRVETASLRDVVWQAYDFVKDHLPDIASPECWREVVEKLGTMGSAVWDEVIVGKAETFTLASGGARIKYDSGATAAREAWVVGLVGFDGNWKEPKLAGRSVARIQGQARAQLDTLSGEPGFIAPSGSGATDDVPIHGMAVVGKQMRGEDSFTFTVRASVRIEVDSLLETFRREFREDEGRYTLDSFRRQWRKVFLSDEFKVEVVTGEYTLTIYDTVAGYDAAMEDFRKNVRQNMLDTAQRRMEEMSAEERDRAREQIERDQQREDGYNEMLREREEQRRKERQEQHRELKSSLNRIGDALEMIALSGPKYEQPKEVLSRFDLLAKKTKSLSALRRSAALEFTAAQLRLIAELRPKQFKIEGSLDEVSKADLIKGLQA